jgi:tRNA pseudouridine38-40 synthase
MDLPQRRKDASIYNREISLHNYKIIIQYDGTNYAGWQIQKNAVTIQQTITEAIKVLTKEEVNLIGSGRTDSGVHALGQTANFRLNNLIDTHKFKYGLNSILPNDISVIRMEEVDLNFHARFDAKKRSYIYLFSKIKSPFYYRYSYNYKKKINTQALNDLSKVLIGTFDFTSFCIKKSETENKVCSIYDLTWRELKEFYLFYIEADRFLHGMVRTIIGSLLFTFKENKSKDFILEVLNKKERVAAGEAVPAKGLFLYKIKY